MAARVCQDMKRSRSRVVVTIRPVVAAWRLDVDVDLLISPDSHSAQHGQQGWHQVARVA
jgi:hypothetical protein